MGNFHRPTEYTLSLKRELVLRGNSGNFKSSKIPNYIMNLTFLETNRGTILTRTSPRRELYECI